jgi:hypothetical protein
MFSIFVFESFTIKGFLIVRECSETSRARTGIKEAPGPGLRQYPAFLRHQVLVWELADPVSIGQLVSGHQGVAQS